MITNDKPFMTGIVRVGKNAGLRTPCKAKDPKHCPYHKPDTHSLLTTEQLNKFNETATKLSVVNRNMYPDMLRKQKHEAMQINKVPNLSPEEAEIARGLDNATQEPEQEEEEYEDFPGELYTEEDYNEAVSIVTEDPCYPSGINNSEALYRIREDTIKQANALLLVTHPEWLNDKDIGPLIAMHDDEVALRAPDGNRVTIRLQAMGRPRELGSPEYGVLIHDGTMANGWQFEGITQPHGMATAFARCFPPETSVQLSKLPAGTEAYLSKDDGEADTVIMDGSGTAVSVTEGYVHRVTDYSEFTMDGWSAPATIDNRMAQLMRGLMSTAFREKRDAARATREQAKREWENRSVMQKLMDNVRGRKNYHANIDNSNTDYSDKGLFEYYVRTHPTINGKLDPKYDSDGKIYLISPSGASVNRENA